MEKDSNETIIELEYEDTDGFISDIDDFELFDDGDLVMFIAEIDEADWPEDDDDSDETEEE